MSNNNRYYVFRINYDDPKWLMNEIRKGQLRQGWGLSELHLKEDDGTIVEIKKWTKRYLRKAKEAWGERIVQANAERRYRMLYLMVEMKQDDVIIVPKFPSQDKFLICQVGEGYLFDNSRGDLDFGHVIKLKSFNDSSKVFNYGNSKETREIRSKMRSYQSAINNIWSEELQKTINILLSKESDENPRGIDFVIKEIFNSASKSIISSLNYLSPKDVEEVVESICIGAGFEVYWKNHFDSKGGDADLIISKKLPLLDDLQDSTQKIYIQIKKKSGIDLKDYEGIDQLINICKSDDKIELPKILVSTAEEFTEKCVNEAKQHGVILCNGSDLIKLLVRYADIN